MRAGGLHDRLLAAFVLVAVPPLLLLALLATTLVSRSFEATAAAQLESGLEAARTRIEQMRRRADAQVAAVVAEDLATTLPSEDGDRGIADAIAQRRDLQALEIVDAAGRIVSSHHLPAGFGLGEKDAPVPGDDALRFERVAQGYGVAERLALMPARAGIWRGAAVNVRGGPFLDAAFLADLGALMGVELALRDVAGERWVARPGSPVVAWSGGPGGTPPARGNIALGGASYRWAAAPVRPGASLWLVALMPRTPLDTVISNVRLLTLGVAVLALASALAAALLLSGRIARPVRELSDGAKRVAGGDLGAVVDVTTADEIGDLARAFNAMTADLRASRERLLQVERVAAWREMARRLAHELKNPIFPIQLSIETLRRAQSEGRDLPALFHESSDTILEELHALRKIIDEFSEFARMPRPRLRPTDVNALVEQVLALYQARAAVVTIERALAPGLPEVPVDRDLLARALGNLVANALEAMPDGGTLLLRSEARGDGLALEVADTGPGLTEDQRTRLFTPYYTTKKGGTGLGLAIVQGIVADHGGRIEVRSEPGRGTSFVLILPA